MSIFSKIFALRPKIEIVTYDPDDHSILFSCTSKLVEGTHSVDAKVADHKMRCHVRVDSNQAGLYYGIFVDPLEAREHLAVLLPRPEDDSDKREAVRVERKLRVTSQGLPSYQAISYDLSTSGMKLRTAGALAEGYDFACQIELDDETTSCLDLGCQVRWCRPEDDAYLIGVQFVGTPKGTVSRLAFFIKALTKVEKGVIDGSGGYFI